MINKTIISFMILFIMVSCNQVVKEKTIIIVPESRSKIIEPMEAKIMEVLPIKEYQNYVVSGKNVFGINGSSLEPVEFKNTDDGNLKPQTFFKVGGKSYFSIQTFVPGETDHDPAVEEMLYFSQEGETLSIIATLPAYPESDRIEYNSTPYQVKKTTYGEIPTSTVMRNALQEAYICIDGAVKVDGGLWFSVPESYSIRYEGVYFWPLTRSKTRVKYQGRIF